MEKSVKQIVQHLIKHQFLSPSQNKFALMGHLLQSNLKIEWFQKSVISNNTTLVLDNHVPIPVNVNLLQNLNHARALFGFDSSISFVSCYVEPSETALAPGTEPIAITDVIKAMTCTFLNVHVFSVPGQKIDNFSLLQKKRRHWWKSLMNQPELLAMSNVAIDDPAVEQRLEIGSTALDGSPLEVITLWKPDIYEDLQLDESLKVSTMVKFQRKPYWPCLITSQLKLELATWMFLIDSFTVRNKTAALSLHHSLSPFKVAIMVDGKSDRTTELRELQQLFTQQLNQSRIAVLPSGASWTVGHCDSRAIPFVILLDETTLEKGICRLRNRDTSIEVEIHVSEIIEHLKNICRK